MNNYSQAWAFVNAIAGDPDQAVLDWRALHDANKGLYGRTKRGTLPQVWPWLDANNREGYGIFVVISELDGYGRELQNVQSIRSHFVDLDQADADQMLHAAAQASPPPSFYVESSPNKYHVYWPVQPYQDNERFANLQRRLAQFYHGDPAVVDPTRVMRLPGTMHLKDPNTPHLVTCRSLEGFGQRPPVLQLEIPYQNVVVTEGLGERHALGDTDLAAPSIDWLKYGLSLVDPNELVREEWLALTAAFKQAGWTLTDEARLTQIWEEWCARYTGNDPAENAKMWLSIRNTELGWHSFVRRVPSLKAAVTFGGQQQTTQEHVTPQANDATPPMPAPPELDCSGEFLTHLEQQEWFKGCTFVIRVGQILGPTGRFHNATAFNGAYGGKKFIIDGEGKTTDEAWRAALRSTLWTIPKVDHTRFLPHEEHGSIITDDLGRSGVNTYKPAIVRTVEGDPQPFLDHLNRLFPDDGDRMIFLSWLAHNIKYPGYKIPWAPVIQSTEGAGKGVFKLLMTAAVGKPYIHFPNAKELTNSGSRFNAWMRNKLFILADEIKVDDRRDLIEVLKPMISETVIEMESKGVDQDLEDNYSNWLFFTNYKDAVPIDQNGRRYMIHFTPFQTKQDLVAAGMDDAYFSRLYGWLKADGAAIVINWLKSHHVERGQIPMVAPHTTSWDEAVSIGRSPIERSILEAVESGAPGFKNGWVSALSVVNRLRDTQTLRTTPPPHVIRSVLEKLGYVSCGRAPKPFFNEGGAENNTCSELYHFGQVMDPAWFGQHQGWE